MGVSQADRTAATVPAAVKTKRGRQKNHPLPPRDDRGWNGCPAIQGDVRPAAARWLAATAASQRADPNSPVLIAPSPLGTAWMARNLQAELTHRFFLYRPNWNPNWPKWGIVANSSAHPAAGSPKSPIRRLADQGAAELLCCSRRYYGCP
jgi:hypothetical protein